MPCPYNISVATEDKEARVELYRFSKPIFAIVKKNFFNKNIGGFPPHAHADSDFEDYPLRYLSDHGIIIDFKPSI